MINEREYYSVKIEDNLYSFYKEIAVAAGLEYTERVSLKAVKSGGKTWPDYILGSSVNDVINLGKIAGLIKNGEFPAFWIRNASSDNDFELQAKTEGIRKIFTWQGMHNYQSHEYQLSSPTDFSNLVLSEVTTVRELQEWIDVINTELMSGKAIEISVFRNVLDKSNFRIFSALNQDETVATLLFYIHEGIAGIYLVSVKKEYRRTGIGRWLTGSAMNTLIRQGIFTFVLHATPAACSLYKSLNFKEYCNFNIYWMIGKFVTTQVFR